MAETYGEIRKRKRKRKAEKCSQRSRREISYVAEERRIYEIWAEEGGSNRQI